MCISILGGQVDTIPEELTGVRQLRRHLSDEFEADAVVACWRPGVSTAVVARSLGVNANLLRRRVCDAEMRATLSAAVGSLLNSR